MHDQELTVWRGEKIGLAIQLFQEERASREKREVWNMVDFVCGDLWHTHQMKGGEGDCDDSAPFSSDSTAALFREEKS